MRGAKGGFWDRLFSRMRIRKINKEKSVKLEEEIQIKNKYQKKDLKQKQDILINYNQYKTHKYRKYNLKKKGIAKKAKVTIPKTDKIVSKQIIVTNKTNGINDSLNMKSKLQNKIKRKGLSKSEKTPTNVEKKNVSTITKKRIIKRKRGIITQKNIEKTSNAKTVSLINELNKIISENKIKVNEISFQIDSLKNKLELSKTVKEVEEIEIKLIELKRKLTELIENYYNMKNGDFSNIKNDKINKLVDEIKQIDTSFNFNTVRDKIISKLDYYNNLSTTAVNTVGLIYSSDSQKDIIEYKNNKQTEFNYKLEGFNEINEKLLKELEKQKKIINEFNILISKIKPEKIIRVQSDFLATMLHNTGCLLGAFFSIPFLKKPKNIPLFAFGLFTINNSIRSMRKVSTNEKVSYIASADYANQIIKYRNSFNFVDYMINDTLYQIQELKEEYKINFSSYHNYDEYNKNLSFINSIEEKILKQAKQIKELKKSYDKTLDNNYKKVLNINNK